MGWDMKIVAWSVAAIVTGCLPPASQVKPPLRTAQPVQTESSERLSRAQPPSQPERAAQPSRAEQPLPIARPALRLLGLVTTEDGQKVAVINMGSDLLLVKQGEQFGRRFSLTSIADDGVEVSDAIGNQQIRLTLP